MQFNLMICPHCRRGCLTDGGPGSYVTCAGCARVFYTYESLPLQGPPLVIGGDPIARLMQAVVMGRAQ